MNRLVLLLSSGARVAFDLDEATARQCADAVRDYWREGLPPRPHRPELFVHDDDDSDWYVPLAHIVGVQRLPLPEKKPPDQDKQAAEQEALRKRRSSRS